MSVSIIAFLVCSLSPSEALSRHQKFIAGLCIICVCIRPATAVVEFISSFDINLYIPDTGGENYEDMWDGYSAEYSERVVKKYISDTLRDTFAVGCESVSVKFSVADGEMVFERIYILLPREGMLKDTAKIQVYFEKVFDCPVVVAIN